MIRALCTSDDDAFDPIPLDATEYFELKASDDDILDVCYERCKGEATQGVLAYFQGLPEVATTVYVHPRDLSEWIFANRGELHSEVWERLKQYPTRKFDEIDEASFLTPEHEAQLRPYRQIAPELD